MPKFNLFRKIVLLLSLMLIPLLSLYYYNNKTSMNILESELNAVNINQLVFFQNQMNTQIDSLALWPQSLMFDPAIAQLKNKVSSPPPLDLDDINLVKDIQEKLKIHESSSNWKSEIYIYSPTIGRLITTTRVDDYQYQDDINNEEYAWQVREAPNEMLQFYVRFATPQLTDRIRVPNLMIEVAFNSSNIVDILDKFKNDGRSDPFFYQPGNKVITNRSANVELINQLIQELDVQEHEMINKQLELNGVTYWIGSVASTLGGWYLIDYVPLSDIMQPINNNNRLFLFTVGGLLLMSIVVAYVLYSQVQVPIRELIKSFQQIKNANYKVRIKPKGNNEFTYLFHRFNGMAEQIQDLFGRVYLEQLHVKEARLKQLQSQINPHFFYNCFTFITSMAKLNDVRAVVAMTENLASYYRYTTRQEKDYVLLKEELQFVRVYIEIQNLRLQRLSYHIDIPLFIQKMEIPLLLIQPIVENAVLHGLEPRMEEGIIHILGEIIDDKVHLIVEDNGVGMSLDERVKLQAKMNYPMDEKMGCGLWNVHQRLVLRYGEQAGVQLRQSALGGLRVELTWSLNP